MKVVIVEDEPLAVSGLTKALKNIVPELEVIATLESIQDAVQFFSTKSDSFDLVFMDIHLSDGNSFEIFDSVDVDTPIIFTTAYNQYAIEAFKQNSIGYLLKPIKPEPLRQAIEKFRKMAAQTQQLVQQYKQLAASLEPQPQEIKKRFMVYAGQKIKSIKTEDIACCFAESKAVFLLTTTGSTYTLNYTIEKLEELLPSDSFYRVNRKTIVSFSAIDEVIPFSKSKLKLILSPAPPFEVFVPLERMGKFKKWLNS